jgi:hypothetical protein
LFGGKAHVLAAVKRDNTPRLIGASQRCHIARL